MPASRCRQERIAQKSSMQLVAKGDIAEELTRLTHHVDQMERRSRARATVGQKARCLSQEMVREINTMG